MAPVLLLIYILVVQLPWQWKQSQPGVVQRLICCVVCFKHMLQLFPSLCEIREHLPVIVI